MMPLLDALGKAMVPPGTLVDPTNPVNWQHPLNNGRAAWWKVIGNSGWRGANVLRDLVRGGGRNPNDTTLSGTTKPAWNGQSPASGNGSLKYDGSTSYCTAPNSTNLNPTTKITLVTSVNTTTFQNNGCFFQKANADGSVSSPFTQYALKAAGDASTSKFWDFIVNVGGVNTGVTNSIAMTAGKWYRLVGTYDGVTLRMYMNGVADANTTASSGSLTTYSTTVQIGRWGGGQSQYFLGFQDDSSVFFNVCWSPQDVALDYAISRQGYPGVLNYLNEKSYSFPSTNKVAFYNTGNSGDQAAVSTITGTANWDISTGANPFLGIDVNFMGAAGTVSGITYGSANLVLIKAQSVVGGTGRTELWGIDGNDASAPTVVASTYTVTLSGVIADVSASWVSYTGVDQTTPTETTNGGSQINTGVGTSASLTITSTTDLCWHHYSIASSKTSGMTNTKTSRNSVSGAGGTGADSDSGAAVTPAGATTETWTQGITDAAAYAGYAIRPVQTSPPPPPPSGSIFRPAPMDGLGCAGRLNFNPLLSVSWLIWPTLWIIAEYRA